MVFLYTYKRAFTRYESYQGLLLEPTIMNLSDNFLTPLSKITNISHFRPGNDKEGIAFIDDYILTSEQVSDYGNVINNKEKDKYIFKISLFCFFEDDKHTYSCLFYFYGTGI